MTVFQDQNREADKLGKVIEGVEGVASAAVEKGREAGEQVKEVAKSINDAVGKSVKEQPMATLAIAAVVGFVLGALWKS